MNKILAILTLVVIMATGCVKQNYDAPPSACDSLAKVIPTHTIAQLNALYDGDTVLLHNVTIKGKVISTDQYGNFYKKIIVQDTSAGIEIDINDKYLFTTYPVGQEIIVNCDGLILGKYQAGYTLGESDCEGVVRIDPEQADALITKTCLIDSNITPKTLTFDKLTDADVNTLVVFDNVQFIDAELDLTWADAVGQSSQNRHLVDANNDTLIVRTSGYASFAAEQLPQGSGSIIGVLGKYGSDYQLYIRSLDDVKMDNSRF